jgi:hypothetical protein
MPERRAEPNAVGAPRRELVDGPRVDVADPDLEVAIEVFRVRRHLGEMVLIGSSQWRVNRHPEHPESRPERCIDELGTPSVSVH